MIDEQPAAPAIVNVSAETEVAGTPPSRPVPGPRFTTATNLLGLIAFAVFLIYGNWPALTHSAVSRLWFPEMTSVRVADRSLAFQAHWERLPAVLRWTEWFLPGVRGGGAVQARQGLEAVEAYYPPNDSPATVVLVLSILDAEQGNLAAAEKRWRVLDDIAGFTVAAASVVSHK